MAIKKIAFVAMPFGIKETGCSDKTAAPSKVDFDALWNHAYYPALEQEGYLPVRADMQEGSLIIRDMVAQLILADLVVADISIPNANVYYETGLRHGGSIRGCLLFSANWADPVFDLAQIRRSHYTLDTDTPSEQDYQQIQQEIMQGLRGLNVSSNPVRELIDRNLMLQGESAHLNEVRDEVIRFQTDVRACKIKTNAQEAKQAALRILSRYDLAKLPDYSIRELFELVRDVLGWQSLRDFYMQLNSKQRKTPFFQEQIALAESKTGDVDQAIAEIESLIDEYGNSGERCRLLGGFYKQRYFDLDNARKKRLALQASIKHYETGLKLDLNDYGCARNLLVLYPLADKGAYEKAASDMAAHILQVCDHKQLLNTGDNWVDAARLLVAFHQADLSRARELADAVALQELANWEIALCIEFLEILVEQMPETSQGDFHRLIDDFKSDISIEQKDLVQGLKASLMETGVDYRKYQIIKARAAMEGEEVVSVVASGRETVNIANKGDYVVENQTGAKERYIVSGTKFEQRYTQETQLDGGWSTYMPQGRVKGIAVDRGILNLFDQQGSFYITAPWGEAQYVEEGDMFVTTLPLQDDMEIYRIARKEFSETYESI
ncbi:tetratricopeptide repeat-containing protein [Candidatus Thiodiazotropha sp. CDECU1]|uniref:tetratricopeptide repeat-containing protein n=1 Tax=Candidatus Thiodiazotropha sp. CDECU1 TaxID=3065865 RepID=UPI00292D423D|nr:tetratricopeptide repeat-containing protein [Candidatus Thiodiazotropha sp. CDECU1]